MKKVVLFLLLCMSVILFTSCCSGAGPQGYIYGRIKFVCGSYTEIPYVHLYIIQVDGREYLISDEGHMSLIEKGDR